MRLLNLHLRQFRNIDQLSLEFDTPVTIFVGNNGQGKSNILESIHLLLTGHSFRPSKTEHFIQNSTGSSTEKGFSQDQTILRGQVEDQHSVDDVDISVTRVKSIRVNGKKVSGPKLLEKYSTIMFSPESLQSVKGGPELRRELLDDLVVFLNPSSAKVQAEFRKTLRSRNKLLREFKDLEPHEREPKIPLLEAITEKYLSLAVDVTHERLLALDKISPFFAQAMRDISGTNNVDTSVEYVISEKAYRIPDRKQLLNVMHNRTLELGSVETRVGSTLVGPHKHDIRFILNESDARYYASQGQQRALILAFKIAQMMYHRRFFDGRPVLLLDDVFSELDPSKRNFLVEALRRSETQTFLTTTDYEDGKFFDDGSLRMFEVESGQLKEKGAR